MNKLATTFCAAAIAMCIAAGPSLSSADTVVTNGVTWTYTVNSDGANTVTLGATSTTAIPTTAEWSASEIPGSFVITGVTYKVTRIGGNGFYGCTGLKGILRIPYSITHIDCDGCFRGCTGLTGVASWGGLVTLKGNFLTLTNIKGLLPSFSQFTGLAGTGYTTYAMFNECSGLNGVCINGSIKLNVGYMFRKATATKIVLVGPKVTVAANLADGNMFANVSNCKLVVPSPAWNGLATGGTNIGVTYYGPTNEITSLTIDETHRVVSMTPTTEASFVKSLEFASLFKEYLDLDTRINVTNAISFTEGAITDDLVENATFDRLMFAVNTQAQLDGILDAFPADTPIAIDPSGLTENLVIPASSKVYVQMSEADRVSLKTRGFVISFR